MNKDTNCCENCRGYGATQVKNKKAVTFNYCKDVACVCHTSKTKDTLGRRTMKLLTGTELPPTTPAEWFAIMNRLCGEAYAEIYKETL